MYKIGIIQHSSGAPAPAPAPLINFAFPINWGTVYHYTQSNTFGYTTSRVRPTPPANLSLDIYYEVGIGGVGDVFRLYYKESLGVNGLPTFNSGQNPINNGLLNLVQPPTDPMLGYIPILLSNTDVYLSFGVEAGPDFEIYYPSRVATTRAIITIANTTQVINGFNIILDARM